METHSTSWPLIVARVLACNLLQGRLFVTRDQKLAMRRDVGGSVYLLTTNDAAEQLTELSKHFNIKCVLGTLGAGSGDKKTVYCCINGWHVTGCWLACVLTAGT